MRSYMPSSYNDGQLPTPATLEMGRVDRRDLTY
jgi:hypothetical protein